MKNLLMIAGAMLTLSTAVRVHAADDPTGAASATASSDMQRVLDVYRQIAGTPITELSPTLARQQFSAEDAAKIVARETDKAPNAQRVTELLDGLTIPGPGGQLPIRIYIPSGQGPFPVVLYFHGGGFVVATIDTYDASARALANAAGAIVIAVEYRKAPEAKFPAAVDDAFAAYKWTLSKAASLNGDPNRVAVAGESAGGNLATEICLEALHGTFPMPVHQLLIYPVTDFSTHYNSDKQYYNAVPLSTPALVWFTEHYLNEPAEATDQRASPLLASLSGMPAATIIAAEIDPLRDEGKAYADKLTAAGVKVDYKLFPGTTHEFFGMGAVVAAAQQAETFAGTSLKQAFKN